MIARERETERKGGFRSKHGWFGRRETLPVPLHYLLLTNATADS